jgi:hypothetical protein
MNMVDDATGTTCSRLGEQETIWAAVGVLRSWIGKYGVPRALYTDWKNVYKRQPTEGERMRGKAPTTQFGRRCERLEIRIIAARSPQAKGRVERNNGVHQDRLVKKLRRKGIHSYEATNEYLEAEYLPEHNRRFAREAARPENYGPEDTEPSEMERDFPIRDGTMDQQRLGGAVPRAFSAAQAAEQALRADAGQGAGVGVGGWRGGGALPRGTNRVRRPGSSTSSSPGRSA